VQHNPPEQDLAARLARAARRAEGDPFFLGHALARYRAANRLDDEGLAAYLECTTADLVSLALCRMPSPSDSRFRADVERIAEHTGVPPLRIVALLRSVAALYALREAAERPTGYDTLAARDQDGEEQPEADDNA